MEIRPSGFLKFELPTGICVAGAARRVLIASTRANFVENFRQSRKFSRIKKPAFAGFLIMLLRGSIPNRFLGIEITFR